MTAVYGAAKFIQRCNECKDTDDLDLTECDLTQIPQAIYMLLGSVEIKSCFLDRNLLPRLPTKFCTKFTTITHLSISGNKISDLPEELLNLGQLRLLDISGNNFSTLPTVISNMPTLATLRANNNSITDVDISQLSNLPMLREIDLSSNPLTEANKGHLSQTFHAISLLL